MEEIKTTPLKVDLEDPKPTWAEKRHIRIFGYLYVGTYIKPGWTAPIKHYMFLCRKHGYVVDYPHGYYSPFKGTIPIKIDGHLSQLYCPKCEEDRRGS